MGVACEYVCLNLKFSIIPPTLNRIYTAERTNDSILKQGYQNFETIRNILSLFIKIVFRYISIMMNLVFEMWYERWL